LQNVFFFFFFLDVPSRSHLSGDWVSVLPMGRVGAGSIPACRVRSLSLFSLSLSYPPSPCMTLCLPSGGCLFGEFAYLPGVNFDSLPTFQGGNFDSLPTFQGLFFFVQFAYLPGVQLWTFCLPSGRKFRHFAYLPGDKVSCPFAYLPGVHFRTFCLPSRGQGFLIICLPSRGTFVDILPTFQGTYFGQFAYLSVDIFWTFIDIFRYFSTFIDLCRPFRHFATFLDNFDT